jgi:hypothetical protein
MQFLPHMERNMPDFSKEELVKLEKQFWQALVDKDVVGALRLTHDPCIVTGPQGVAKIDNEKFVEMMEKDTGTLKSFELKDIEVEQISDDVAIIGYKVREDLTVDGKPVKMEAADSSTWVRKNGHWKCAMHTEAVTGDPYGRDRIKKAA